MTLLGVFLFTTLLIINYVVYKRKQLSKTFFIISTIILLINFILIYILYYNNISLGFESGVAIGDLNGIYIDDEFKYFYESEMLSKILPDHGLLSWFNRTLPESSLPIVGLDRPFGFYNPFVFLLSLLRLVGLTHLNELLVLKLIFVLINSLLIYDISKNLCNKKFIYAPLIVFNLAPAYILVNITLSRDIIITTLIIYIFRFILLKDKNYKKLIIPLFFLLVFRAYAILALFGTMILLFRNSKKLFSMFDMAFIVLIFLGILLFLKLNIPIEQVAFLKSRLIDFHGDSIYTPIVLTFRTLWDIFAKSPYLQLLNTTSLYCILVSLSSLYYMLLSLLFIFKILTYVFSNKTEDNNRIIKLTLYFTLLNSYILMMRDGFITARITNMWFFMFSIIIFIPYENFLTRFLTRKNADFQ